MELWAGATADCQLEAIQTIPFRGQRHNAAALFAAFSFPAGSPARRRGYGVVAVRERVLVERTGPVCFPDVSDLRSVRTLNRQDQHSLIQQLKKVYTPAMSSVGHSSDALIALESLRDDPRTHGLGIVSSTAVC